MKRTRIAILILLFLGMAAGAAWLPAPALSQDAAASIAGVVIRADTGAPIAGSQVTLIPAGLVVSTGEDGRFLFPDLAAGGYNLSAIANGYARRQYGETATNLVGVQIVLRAGESRNVVLPLTPTGAVSGRVLDSNGRPAPGVEVHLLRRAFSITGSGAATLGIVISERTNDLGEYRIWGVTPGRYYVAGGGKPPSPTLRAVFSGNAVRRFYPYTYYPNAADFGSAASIEVRPESELAGVDFVLRPIDPLRIRGRIVDSRTGRPPDAVSVQIASMTGVNGVNADAPWGYDPADGSFEVADLVPGSYTVSATARENSADPPTVVAPVVVRVPPLRPPTGFAIVDVTGEDVDGVVITLRSGVAVTGTAIVEGGAVSPLAPVPHFSLRPLQPLAQQLAPQPVSTVVSDGTFIITNLFPGDYRLQIIALPNDYYVKAAEAGGRDILNQPFRFTGSAADTIVVTLRPGAGRVEGTVVDALQRPAPGIQAVLVPDVGRDRSELFRVATPGADGRFAIPNVVPGSYRVFAWESIELQSYFDPEVVNRFEQQGIPVTVSENGIASVTVPVIPVESR